MAIGDSYATAATYRAITDKDSTTEDSEILSDLTAVSRYLETRLHQYFNIDASVVTRLYDGDGTERLYLTSHDNCPGIATTSGLIVKVDLNADYDVSDSGETLTINTDFWVGPWDSALGSEVRPYRYIDLNPTSSIVTRWPRQRRAVSVTAKFGWAAVPGAIERATCHLTALLRLETPRSFSTRSEIGEIVDASRQAQSIITSLYSAYAAIPTL